MVDHGAVEKTGRLRSPLSLDGQPTGTDPVQTKEILPEGTPVIGQTKTAYRHSWQVEASAGDLVLNGQADLWIFQNGNTDRLTAIGIVFLAVTAVMLGADFISGQSFAQTGAAQGYTPFEGLELGARVKATFLRGELVCENGNVLGKPRGNYLFRPTA